MLWSSSTIIAEVNLDINWEIQHNIFWLFNLNRSFFSFCFQFFQLIWGLFFHSYFTHAYLTVMTNIVICWILTTTWTSTCIVIHFSCSSGSWCPFPRRENVTTANAIATPIAAPYTAIDASAMSNTRHNCIYYLS